MKPTHFPFIKYTKTWFAISLVIILVGIGTMVRALDVETGTPEEFRILGAWDSDPDQGTISYLSPVAQALLNKKVGDEVEFEAHGMRHHHRIDTIEAITPSALAAIINMAPASAPAAEVPPASAAPGAA